MKLTPILAACLLGTLPVLAQGTVNFNNSPSAVGGGGAPLSLYLTNGTDGVRLSGNAYLAQLYAGPDANSLAPVGVAMGVVVPVMTLVSALDFAYPLLVIVGTLAGFFVVPMNALLQHRGHVLMSAGHSIAVQNFNENLNVLLMLGLYALLIRLNLGVNAVITLFGPTDQAWSETHDPRAIQLQHILECGPCQQRVCPLGHHRCMTELTVDEVWEAVERAWLQSQPRSRALRRHSTYPLKS